MFRKSEEKQEEEFLTEIYNKYYPLMKKRIRDIIKDENMLEDMIHTVILKFVNNIKTLKKLDPAQIVVYIDRSCKNTAYNYVQKRSRKQEFEFVLDEDTNEEFIDNNKNPENLYLQHEKYEFYTEALKHLNDKERDLLVKRFLYEMSDKQIAEEMDIKVEQVRVYVSRARKKLIKIMKESGEEHATRN